MCCISSENFSSPLYSRREYRGGGPLAVEELNYGLIMQNRELLVQFPILLCLPLVRLFFSDPRGMNYIHPSRDQSLKGSPIVKSYLYLDSSRFPQPARHELCPCCVRPIAARLSSFWQLLYQNLFLMQNRELLMQFPIYYV